MAFILPRNRSHSALTNILNQAEVFEKALRFQAVESVGPSLNSLSVGRSFHQIAEYSLSIQSTLESSILLMLVYGRMEIALDFDMTKFMLRYTPFPFQATFGKLV